MSKFPESLFTAPPGGDFLFLGAVPYATNRLLTFFSLVPLADDPEGFDSVTNRANWTIEALDPTQPLVSDPDNPFVPEGEVVPTFTPEIGQIFVDDDDAKQVHLWFNSRLEPRVRYRLTAGTELRTADCEDIEEPRVHDTRSLLVGTGPTPRFITQDRLRDFDWRYFPTDPLQPTSTFRYDTTGDIGIQSEDLSLRKRLLRRITAQRGSFRNLSPQYGGDLDAKTLARSGRIQELANRVAEQARQEPDVRDAGAEARLKFSAEGHAAIEIAVRALRVGRRESRFTLDVPLSSTDA